jgi:tRNA threonylcarbamoyl adenosine modification protein YjeE
MDSPYPIGANFFGAGIVSLMPSQEQHFAKDEAATRAIGAGLSRKLRKGDVVLLDGPLGAGKTTFVRGLVEALHFDGPVRSPTFNLIQTFDTKPPVMHADLYRVSSHEGIGLEEYLDSHLCLIEWPDRASGLVDPTTAWHIHIDFADSGRAITVNPPCRHL